jgi:hypothetical protein
MTHSQKKIAKIIKVVTAVATLYVAMEAQHWWLAILWTLYGLIWTMETIAKEKVPEI